MWSTGRIETRSHFLNLVEISNWRQILGVEISLPYVYSHINIIETIPSFAKLSPCQTIKKQTHNVSQNRNFGSTTRSNKKLFLVKQHASDVFLFLISKNILTVPILNRTTFKCFVSRTLRNYKDQIWSLSSSENYRRAITRDVKKYNRTKSLLLTLDYCTRTDEH